MNESIKCRRDVAKTIMEIRNQQKQQTINTYNAAAQAMADKFSKISPRIEDVARIFTLISKNDPFVLEIGCGNGREAVEILKRTNNYLGIDVSESMIQLARRRAPNGSFVIADVDDCNFPPNLDAIVSFASLLHSDSESLVKILHRASISLSANGIFYISLKHGSGQQTKTDEFGTRTFFFYTPKDMKNMAEKKYDVIWENIQQLGDQKWFTIVLKKNTESQR